MPDLAGPFDLSTFAQAQYYRDRGYMEASGVQGAPYASASAGDLALTAAGFALTLALGRGHVRGAAYERTGTAWSYTVPANSSSVGPRNDLLVLRRDLVAKTVVPAYVQGVAAATPADPAINSGEDTTWDEPLFRVVAPANSGTPLAITDLRRAIPLGIRRAVSGESIAGRLSGEYRDNPAKGLQRWTGSAWQGGFAAAQSIIGWTNTTYSPTNNYNLGTVTIDPQIGPYLALIEVSGTFTTSAGCQGGLRALASIGGGASAVVASGQLTQYQVSNYQAKQFYVGSGQSLQVWANLNVIGSSNIIAYSDGTHSYLSVVCIPLLS